MSLPSGTVTFLFTDIEDSTRLWEEQPQAMRAALARHDRLLRQAIDGNAGVVFKTIGDAFCAAFATAPDALRAALAAQRALVAEPWPDPLTLRVRMALHTGDAELRDNDYFGQALNRVARLLAAGHGGQTLLSDVAHDLTRDALPPSVTCKPLGEHRLKNLGRPEPVFQMLHPDLPSVFPPLKSLDHPDLPNNLPRQVTSFIGREQEMAEVKALLGRTRLLTLTGSGGCGKTRLGVQAAADMLESYPEGIWFVELAPLTDATLVPQAIAQTLSLTEEPGKSQLQTLVEFLKTRRLLLILDNCEHVLDACARVADAVLKSCLHVRILASSREALGISGEQTYRIPSLALPDAHQEQTAQSVSHYEAARLFIERAVAVQSTFVVTDSSASALAQLCVRLDGIPFAIELAAARVRSLSLSQINARLDNRFHLLTGGSRTALPHQQTLRALIDWSFDLLSPQKQALLCRLSVFAGGYTLEAAEAISSDAAVEEWEMLDLLTSLVDKSLLVADPGEGAPRFRLLETVRQYAREGLEARGESALIRDRHQAFFLAFAETAEPHLKGPDGERWLDRLETDHDNLRVALEWAGNEAALRIAGALYSFWEVRGYFTEGRKRLTDALAGATAQGRTLFRAKALSCAGALARVQGDPAAARALLEESLTLYRERNDRGGIAYVLTSLGNLAYGQGDYVVARSLYEEGLALRQELGDRAGMAQSLSNLGNIAYFQGDFVQTRALYEAGLALARELGNKGGIAHSLTNLGLLASEQAEFARAHTLLDESLALAQELGNKGGIAYALYNLGNLAYFEDDRSTAHSRYEESLVLYRELGDKGGIAGAHLGLGNLASRKGDYVQAHSLLEESLVLCQEFGNRGGIAEALEAFATLALMQKQAQRATHLWGAAEALRSELGAPMQSCNRPLYDQQVAQARYVLSEAPFTAAWSTGHTMPTDQAISYALENT